MSFNNFSYFNGPTTPTAWWGSTNSTNPTLQENRIPPVGTPIRAPWPKTIVTSEYNIQPFIPATVQNFAQSMILPSEKRPSETAHSLHEVKQGTVTQLFANFGYINDNIIFSKSDVIGQMVQVGDKVAVDATYQPNNPTNYKGERVCKLDESRFNSTGSSSSGKMITLAQGSNPRIETTLRNRLDYKYDTHESSPRIESSIKSRLDYKYDTHESSPRNESSIKSRLDQKYDTHETSPRTESSVKSRLDYRYETRDTSPRSESSIKNRLDYTYETRELSPRNEPSIKSRLDYKYSSRDLSPRLEISVKNRLDHKYESSSRSDEAFSSHKKSKDLKSTKRSSIKERLTITKEKARQSDKKAIKRKAERKIEPVHKEEVVKRKAISPIKFKESPKARTSAKRKSDSKPKLVPKSYENFSLRELDCAAVKNQCRTLALPKEFFHVSLKYQHSFPLNHPMKLGNNCHFKIMDKKVKSIDSFIDAQLNKDIDPEDADTTFVAKVMLLSTDDLAKFYKDILTLAEEFEGENKIPITKAIKFIVGGVGPGKEFGIGGSWSASLDGADPETNPRVLINTAIRTCKAITGIDLSNCSSWPKFLELHYYRPQQKPKKMSNNHGELIIDVDAIEEPTEYSEPRMETVVYYIPDVWSCIPSQDSWNETIRLYQEQLTCLMCPPPAPVSVKSQPITAANSATTISVSTNSNEDVPTNEDEKNKAADGLEQDEEDWNCNETDSVDEKLSKNSEEDSNMEEQPTHFSKLVVAGMKIVDIKKELELRKLNNRGVMEQLKARLKAVLDREETEEKNRGSSDPTSVVATATIMRQVSKTILTEEQKTELKKLYTLPGQQHIIVHQNRKWLGNQMKIRLMSLHSLLSYNNVTLQENTFELALFAKQFLEMLRRDAVFNIYKSIVVAPEADLVNVDNSDKKSKLMVTTSKRTINRPLLFSCSLLDREKTNKISLEDLKILIEGLGICLSTKQLSAVLDKVKDSSKYFNYRQLTDKEMTDSDIAKMLNIDMSEDLDYIKELALGNKALFDSEDVHLDSSMNDDEMERLKNELDKSERCRQSLELKVAEMKEDTEKNINLAQGYVKEIAKLKEQGTEYRTKYRGEQDRSEFYKRDFDRVLRYLKEVDKMSLGLNKFVSEGLQKYVNDAKKVNREELATSAESKGKVVKIVEKSKKNEKISVKDLDKVTDISIETSSDVEMSDRIDGGGDHKETNKEEDQQEMESITKATITVNSSVEDFELSKPSDYDDMIILDETE